MNRNFAQRAQLRKLGIIVLVLGLMIGLAACIFMVGPTASLRISSPSPMAMFEAPLRVVFDISASTGDIRTFTLAFGDGTEPHSGTDIALPIRHTYTTAGVFHARLTVTDRAGATSTSEIRIDTLPVRVYFSDGAAIHRVETRAGASPERVGGVSGSIFPSLRLNTRDRIAFTGQAPVTPVNWDIYTMATDGRFLSRLTVHADREIQPAWSHDGTAIAYARQRAGLWEIWTIPAGGGIDSMLITQTPAQVWAPAFSPINDDLVFVRQAPGAVSELWIRRVGAAPALLYSVTGIRVGDPSPAIAIIPPLDLPTGAGISQPRWSPCGRMIVFARGTAADIDIHVLTVPALGTAPSVTLEAHVRAAVPAAAGITTAVHEFSPHWLEDGNIVFIRETAAGVFHLYHVNLRTGVLIRLAAPAGAMMPAQR